MENNGEAVNVCDSEEISTTEILKSEETATEATENEATEVVETQEITSEIQFSSSTKSEVLLIAKESKVDSREEETVQIISSSTTIEGVTSEEGRSEETRSALTEEPQAAQIESPTADELTSDKTPQTLEEPVETSDSEEQRNAQNLTDENSQNIEANNIASCEPSEVIEEKTEEASQLNNLVPEEPKEEVSPKELSNGTDEPVLNPSSDSNYTELIVSDEDEQRSHTWKPKGTYEIQKTEVKYEEVVPCTIPDVDAQGLPSKKQNASADQDSQNTEHLERSSEDKLKAEHSLDTQKLLRQTIMSGEPISPLEIPIGIPLLAKILPREETTNDEHREKISLERLFTPATDAENLIPQKKKRAYASSCFYRPEHPTIDDQVELAHKISVSLIDENNKASKGQTMYIKRKNRSSKWIHQGEAADSHSAWQDDTEENEIKTPIKEKPNLKLVLNPKGIQDYTTVQRHYEDLMASTTESTQYFTRMEVGKEIAAHLESPTGKGAELFQKRKKRMDKFIVDETTIQQQQEQLLQQQQQQQQQQMYNSDHQHKADFSTQTVLNETQEASLNFAETEKSSTRLLDEIMQIDTGSSFSEMSSTSNAGEVAIYTANVKLLQNPLLTIVSDLPERATGSFRLETQAAADSNEERTRKSFNLAPKGWGTYTDFYTPIHLGAQ